MVIIHNLQGLHLVASGLVPVVSMATDVESLAKLNNSRCIRRILRISILTATWDKEIAVFFLVLWRMNRAAVVRSVNHYTWCCGNHCCKLEDKYRVVDLGNWSRSFCGTRNRLDLTRGSTGHA